MPSFDFSAHQPKEIKEVIKDMRREMQLSGGIGLSANQVGLEWRMFIASYRNKFYAVFNPVITKQSSEKETLEEGCLSIPETFINVPRSVAIVIEGFDQNGKKLKIKTSGIMARIFQHELDHLNGKLITDYVK